jgi:hypothetical protein
MPCPYETLEFLPLFRYVLLFGPLVIVFPALI